MKFAFVLYSGIEPIDLATIGVVSMARRVIPELSYLTVGGNLSPCIFSNGLKVLPDYTFELCPAVDAIIIPGGPGWVEAAVDEALLAFLTSRATSSTLIAVCTGGMILAAAGLLNGKQGTTKCAVVDPEISPLVRMRNEYPEIDVREALVVDQGNVITGGGVTLCIDTMLHVLSTRINIANAAEVARIIEYAASLQANKARLPTLTI